MDLDALGDKQLLIFAGKGGVGKTTCSSATALHFARQGKKTLLVTVDPAKRLEDSLGVPLKDGPTKIEPNLWASMLDPEEIIRNKLQSYAEGKRVLEHPLYKYVTNYLPGLNELMAIGRLNEIRHENAYDLIVIDTAPTGHALSFLSAPKAIQELMSEKSILRWVLKGYNLWMRFSKASKGIGKFLGSGQRGRANQPGNKGATTDATEGDEPLGSAEDLDLEAIFRELAEEAKGIQDMLTDADRTALNIVTLPEKLPVEETIDLHEHAATEIGIHIGFIFVNKVQPDPLGKDEPRFLALIDDQTTRKAMQTHLVAADYPEHLFDALIEATEFSDRRRRMNMVYIGDLTVRLPQARLVLLPLFKEDIQGIEMLGRLAHTIYGA